MKVCTDACLYGAYIANECKDTPVKNILDIGGGTGLLSLMLAQKINAVIDTVEIDPDAFAEAKENIAVSPFNNRIHIFNANITQFAIDKKYDCIISNPPFFEADLLSPDKKKNAAKHDTTLTYDMLLQAIHTHLTADGIFAVLLPYHRSQYFEMAAAAFNFHLHKKISVKQSTGHNYFRVILIFSTAQLPLQQMEITIKDAEGNYTPAFTELLQDYYLYL